MLRHAPLLLAALAVVAGCSPAAPDTCDSGVVRAVRATAASGREITVCGSVASVRRARFTRSGRHQTFYVQTAADDRIAIDADLDVLGTLPVRVRETAIVRGEYYRDPDGRDGVHWTHRTTHGPHPPGYVTLAGVRYE